MFEGGVLVITHNRDFSESLCKEYVDILMSGIISDDSCGLQSVGYARWPLGGIWPQLG